MKLSLFSSDHVQFSQIVEYIDRNCYPSLEEVITFKGKRYRFIVRGNNKVSIEVDGKYFTVGRFEEADGISKEYKMYTLVREFFASFPLEEQEFPLFNGALEKYDIKFVVKEEFVKTKNTFDQREKADNLDEFRRLLDEATEKIGVAFDAYQENIQTLYRKLTERQ